MGKPESHDAVADPERNPGAAEEDAMVVDSVESPVGEDATGEHLQGAHPSLCEYVLRVLPIFGLFLMIVS